MAVEAFLYLRATDEQVLSPNKLLFLQAIWISFRHQSWFPSMEHGPICFIRNCSAGGSFCVLWLIPSQTLLLTFIFLVENSIPSPRTFVSTLEAKCKAALTPPPFEANQPKSQYIPFQWTRKGAFAVFHFKVLPMRTYFSSLESVKKATYSIQSKNAAFVWLRECLMKLKSSVVEIPERVQLVVVRLLSCPPWPPDVRV